MANSVDADQTAPLHMPFCEKYLVYKILGQLLLVPFQLISVNDSQKMIIGTVCT